MPAGTEPEDFANGFLQESAVSTDTAPAWEPASSREGTKRSWRKPPLRPEAQTSTSALQSGRTLAKNGLFTKDRFLVDLGTDTVTCPNDVTVKIRRLKDGDGIAKFATHCVTCPLAWQCTTSRIGRKIRVGIHEAV